MKPTCELLGKSRATLYRHARKPAEKQFASQAVSSTPDPAGATDRPSPAPRPAPRNALSPVERATVLETLRSDRFVDKSPAQVWAVLLDEGTYLASVSTMYRLLRANGEVSERRAQATHPAKTIPVLHATAPDVVWSWDITKLKTGVKGKYLDLYVLLDIFSRKVIGWRVEHGENGPLAADFIRGCIAGNGGVMPGHIHADRGTSMTSKTVAQLLSDLRIDRSHSRPHVSNDNPYSEAVFKTLKYAPVFPERFASIQDARDFCSTFFDYYNHRHRHTGIGLHTPASVHDGTAATVQTHRETVMTAAYHANPTRFRHQPPRLPTLPDEAWINQPPQEHKEQPSKDSPPEKLAA